MRLTVVVESLEACGESHDIEVELDHRREVVTLHMLEFKAEEVTQFVTQTLPREFSVRVDVPPVERAPSTPGYALVIALAGRHHPAKLRRLTTGRVSVSLGDPDALYLARCRRAIAQLLSALHGRGVPAVVTGIDRHGRPKPSEGFLHLFADTAQGTKEEEILQLCREVGQEHRVDIILLRALGQGADTAPPH